MIDRSERIQAAFLVTVVVLGVFVGSVSFSTTVSADDAVLRSTDAPSSTVQSGESVTVSNVTIEDTDSTAGVIEIDNISVDLNTTGIGPADVSSVALRDPAGNVIVENTSADNVSVEFASFQNAGRNSSLSDSDGDGTDELVIDQGSQETFAVVVDTTATADGTLDNETVTVGLATTSDENFSRALRNSTTTDTQPITVGTSRSGDPELLSAVHYDDSGDEGVGVELAFSETVTYGVGDITLYEDDSVVGGATVETPSPSRRVFVSTPELLSGDVEIRLSGDVEDLDGNTVDDTGDNSVTVAPVTLTANDGKSAYRGEHVAVVSEQGRNVDVGVEGPDGYFFDGSTDTNSEVFVFDTGGRDLAQYNFSIDDSAVESTQLVVRDLSFELTVDDDSAVNESIDGTVEGRASNRPIALELRDSDGDTVGGSRTETTLDGQGEYEFTYDPFDTGLDLEEGNYTVFVTDEYSGIDRESAQIRVAQRDDGDAGFSKRVITDTRGDVVEIPIETTVTDTATVTIGGAAQGVVANVTVEDGNDDGTVSVFLNTTALRGRTGTYADGGPVFSVDPDTDDRIVAADIGTSTGDLIDAGQYDLEVRTGPRSDGESADLAVLSLQERNRSEITTWTAADGFDPSTSTAITERRGDGDVIRASEVTNGDVVLLELHAPGFEGTFDAQHTDDITDRLLNGSDAGTVYTFSIEQTDPGVNRDAFVLALGPENTTVLADGDNDTYYVVVETSAVTTADGTAVPDDEGVTANFTVFNRDGTDFTSEELDDGGDETTLADYEIVEPDVTVAEPHNVSKGAERTVGGDTTLAPGTELTLRVRSTDETGSNFLKTAEPVVRSNRTWRATFDFSDRRVGDRYEIVVKHDRLDGAVIEEGAVVASVDTTEVSNTVTTAPTASTASTVSDPDTTTAVEVGTDAETTESATTTAVAVGTDAETAAPGADTPTSTPGFDVVVALAALLVVGVLSSRLAA